MLWGIQNYIDMEKVLPADDTLKQGLNNLITAKLDLEKNQTKLLELEEYRTELYDDNINFMGLSEPKQIDYLNFAENARDYPMASSGAPISVVISLGQKATI